MSTPCPSDETLEQLDAGQLTASEAEAVRRHVSQCASCRDRTRLRQSDAALLDDLRVVLQRQQQGELQDVLGTVPARGVRFGRYEIQDLLGTGGMSKVYRAVDTDSGLPVALKLLKGEHVFSAESRARFEREAAALSRIDHPNVLAVYGFPAEGHHLALAMELLVGGSLREWIAERHRLKEAFDPALVLLFSRQAADGLAAAHRAGLIHRDIKPSNLLLDEHSQVKVSDFGVVSATEMTTWVTGTGQQIGTPAYMSPEQCKGEKTSPASDVYSLGVTMFELVTGRLPFEVEGDSPFAQMLRHISEPAPDPAKYNPQIGDGFASVILRCLEKDQASRYGDGNALGEALAEAMKAGPASRLDTPTRRTWNINFQAVRRQVEELPQASIVTWACHFARDVLALNPDPRVARAIELAESVAMSAETDAQPASTRILARM
ncbi:MAG: protein kinase, partial [Phycisphaerae bacterium]